MPRTKPVPGAPAAAASGRRIGLRLKLLGSFSIVLALTALIGILGIRTASGLSTEANAMYQEATLPLSNLGDARAHFNENRAFTNLHLLATDRKQQEELESKIAANAKEVDEHLAAAEKGLTTAKEKASFATLRVQIEAASNSRGRVLALSKEGHAVEALAIQQREGVPAALKASAEFESLAEIKGAFAETSNKKIVDSAAAARTTAIIILLIAILVSLGIALWLASRIQRGVGVILDRLNALRENCTTDLRVGLVAVTNGDLTVEITPGTSNITRLSNDEIGDVAEAVGAIRDNTVAAMDAYNEMRTQLAAIMSELADTAGTVDTASQEMASTSEEAGRAVGEIAAAVTDVAHGAERQVRMVESTREAVQEASRAAAASAEGAIATAAAADHARAVAVDGVGAAEHATQAMNQVADSSRQVGVAIEALSARSEKIGGIVDTITGIAEQTNLLALNAAIEAARAGEQGRGFAVVAEEVRKLAEESQAAAGQISSLIREIQTDTSNVVGVVAEGERLTADGAATVGKTRDAFEQIGTAVDDVSARVSDIAASVQQIAAGTLRAETDVTEVAAVAEQSSASAEQVSASTQQTSAATQEIAASAQTLATTAGELSSIVSRFKVAA
jgi:methyl-accepting chemotaxis protein